MLKYFSKAPSQHSPVTIDIVVESELFAFYNIAFGEYAHAHMLADVPFGNEAIGVAAMIHEPTFPAFLRRIQILYDNRNR